MSAVLIQVFGHKELNIQKQLGPDEGAEQILKYKNKYER